jgi:hypothetical protein
MRLHRLLIPLAALIPILPLLRSGYSCGHDFDFHVLSWLEAAGQLARGHYPVWAYTPAWNAGEPRFVFYPPASWLIGAVLGLILPWHFAPMAFTWLALTLSGFSLHGLAARYASPAAATLAGAFYLSNPYMLFTAYERTAYGELLAAAWIPMLLAAILAPRLSVAAVAVPVALLWLTNAPAAVMSCYALALLALVRLVWAARQRRRAASLPFERLTPAFSTPAQVAVCTTAGVVLGLALAAFYILPAAWERGWVQTWMAMVPGMAIADNTLFHHTPDEAHDAVLHTASLLAVLLLLATGISLAAITPRRLARITVPLALLTVAIAFLLTPWSLPLWQHAPELKFLQFPWRFLALLAAALAFALALAFRRLTLKPWLLAVLTLALVGALSRQAYHVFNQPCDAPDTVEARVARFHSPAGTEPTDEYTPTTADNDSLRHNEPPYWLSADPDAQPAAGAAAGPLSDHFTLNAPAAKTLILNRRSFPLWSVTLNGKPAQLDPPNTREDGLIALPIPAGTSNIILELRHTPDELAGLFLSLAALLALVTLRKSFPEGGAGSG